MTVSMSLEKSSLARALFRGFRAERRFLPLLNDSLHSASRLAVPCLRQSQRTLSLTLILLTHPKAQVSPLTQLLLRLSLFQLF